MFQHEARDILLCVHVDDLLCTGLRDDLMWLKKQFLKIYELETLVGDDDDMVKKAVYFGGTLEWSENGLGVRPDRRHVRSLLRELEMENCRNIFTPLCATVEMEGTRRDHLEVSAELATKHRATVPRVVYLAQDRLDFGVAAVELAKNPWQFQERVTTNVSNVLQDISMVILTTCNGTQFRKKQTQLSCPRMPIRPFVAKYVVQIQEAL